MNFLEILAIILLVRFILRLFVFIWIQRMTKYQTNSELGSKLVLIFLFPLAFTIMIIIVYIQSILEEWERRRGETK